MKSRYDVVIIGAGPAGIGAATELQKNNIHDILIIDREDSAGGVPRHCQHPTFGLLTYKIPMKGNIFVSKILSKCRNIEIVTSTTVVSIHPNGKLILSNKNGLTEVVGKRVIIATGVRETPRHPRLISGVRPLGVLTVGALQQFTYIDNQKACNNAVIVGSDLVSFSAIWTLRNAKSKCIAMVEKNKRITAYLAAYIFAKIMNVKIYTSARIINIHGNNRVETIDLLTKDNQVETIKCDSVIFTGDFVGEYTLIRKSHLEYNLATGAPVIDQNNQCSDPCYYTAGNMNHPADMGDICYKEGLKIGNIVANSFKESVISDQVNRINIEHSSNIKFIYPSCVNLQNLSRKIDFIFQVSETVYGNINIMLDDKIIFSKRKKCLAHRNIKVSNLDLTKISSNSHRLKVLIES